MSLSVTDVVHYTLLYKRAHHLVTTHQMQARTLWMEQQEEPNWQTGRKEWGDQKGQEVHFRKQTVPGAILMPYDEEV
jgi:hypothetical protein